MTNLPPPLLILHSLRDLLASYTVSAVNMPPIPAVRPNKPLERGQTTIFSTLNGAISIQRPTPPRPGPRTKSTGQANTVLGRRLTGGQNEKQV
jgi:hypothetical protein